jgi:hypothetical protein
MWKRIPWSSDACAVCLIPGNPAPFRAANNPQVLVLPSVSGFPAIKLVAFEGVNQTIALPPQLKFLSPFGFANHHARSPLPSSTTLQSTLSWCRDFARLAF